MSALPSAPNSLSINQIAQEFGGDTPHAISEYYAGGDNVPAGTHGEGGGIPSSGSAISIGDFFGSRQRITINLTISSNTQSYQISQQRGGTYEAGFTDIDGDGILGEGDPDVDENGQVITDDEDGYVDPVDADGNGILDCYDAVILVVTIDSQPQYAGDIFQGENVSYSVGVTIDGNLPPEYQWQIGIVSDDEQDTTWTDITESSQFVGVNTSTLTINNVSYEEFDNTQYRAKVTAKGYTCAFVLTDPVNLDVKIRDLHIPQGFSPDGDGINDKWKITGIEYYPNNTVQIYNRWEIKIWEVDGYLNDSPEKFFEGIANTGSSNGMVLPETVYFYVVDLGDIDIDGNSISEESRYRKGIVYIRRPNE